MARTVRECVVSLTVSRGLTDQSYPTIVNNLFTERKDTMDIGRITRRVLDKVIEYSELYGDDAAAHLINTAVVTTESEQWVVLRGVDLMPMLVENLGIDGAVDILSYHGYSYDPDMWYAYESDFDWVDGALKLSRLMSNMYECSEHIAAAILMSCTACEKLGIDSAYAEMALAEFKEEGII